jgi:hypothetical protein
LAEFNATTTTTPFIATTHSAGTGVALQASATSPKAPYGVKQQAIIQQVRSVIPATITMLIDEAKPSLC